MKKTRASSIARRPCLDPPISFLPMLFSFFLGWPASSPSPLSSCASVYKSRVFPSSNPSSLHPSSPHVFQNVTYTYNINAPFHPSSSCKHDKRKAHKNQKSVHSSICPSFPSTRLDNFSVPLLSSFPPYELFSQHLIIHLPFCLSFCFSPAAAAAVVVVAAAAPSFVYTP